MWSLISPVNLIRYLIVWRVNRSLVQLPRCLSTVLSLVLGTLIAERLPTQQARSWRKMLAAWGNILEDALLKGPALSLPKGPIPDAAWPIETVLFPYPGKRVYGQGEAILWELKLLGNDADHGLFLELILPAMEEAASTSDPRWYQPRSLWGRFDVQAIYAARGLHWEPVVSDGRLDLTCRPGPTQWAEELALSLHPMWSKGQVPGTPVLSQVEASEVPGTGEVSGTFRRLTWVTPVDLGESLPPPSLQAICDALMARMTLFLPGKRPTPDQAWALLGPEEQQALQLDLETAAPIRSKRYILKPAPKGWPGRWIGTQAFRAIPPRLVSYLELASILHIGKRTHFGCGTFTLSA